MLARRLSGTDLPWLVCIEIGLDFLVHCIHRVNIGEVLDNTAAIVSNGLDNACHIMTVNALDLVLLHGHGMMFWGIRDTRCLLRAIYLRISACILIFGLGISFRLNSWTCAGLASGAEERPN